MVVRARCNEKIGKSCHRRATQTLFSHANGGSDAFIVSTNSKWTYTTISEKKIFLLIAACILGSGDNGHEYICISSNHEEKQHRKH